MRRKSALGFVALSLFATGMGVATAVPATASPEDTAAPVRVDASRWTTQGRWVTDAQHRVVITQGINEVAKSAPYAPDAVGFGEDDAAFLEAQGFTSVRLGVLWAGVEPRPGVYDDAYLARVERTVRILNAHGIASVLDFHQDMVNEKYQGEGWPAWAALDHGMPNIVKTGFPGNYFLNEAVKYSFDSFYDNAKASDGIGVADHYASAWRHVAEHFRNVPGVQGYDLFNEPFPGHRYTRCLTQLGCRAADARLSAVQQKTVDAIRSVDKATTVWYEPMQLVVDIRRRNCHASKVCPRICSFVPVRHRDGRCHSSAGNCLAGGYGSASSRRRFTVDHPGALGDRRPAPRGHHAGDQRGRQERPLRPRCRRFR